MKHLSLSLATVALLSVSLTTQAGFLDDALKIAQALQSGDTGAALNQAANGNSTKTTSCTSNSLC